MFLSKWVIFRFHVTLPETNSLHLKMEDWKATFLWGSGPFSGAMLILGRVIFEGIPLLKTPSDSTNCTFRRSSSCAPLMMGAKISVGQVNLLKHFTVFMKKFFAYFFLGKNMFFFTSNDMFIAQRKMVSCFLGCF